jgi:peptidoglycan hydrolase CwlO-like protein
MLQSIPVIMESLVELHTLLEQLNTGQAELKTLVGELSNTQQRRR